MAEPNESVEEVVEVEGTTGESKKEKKKREKAEKKAKKKKGKDELEDEVDEPEGLGTKIVLVFVTLLIVAIWLGMIAIMIKCDLGGFGSTYLQPLLKDVPYVNRILPNTGENVGTESTENKYNSLDDAVERIKELEMELDEALAKNGDNKGEIKDLKKQIEKLMVYKQEQAEFEENKEKFYEEVVFNDNAPDINEYKTWYEGIDPANAEVLYKQVVEQSTYNSKIQDYAATYSSMKPKEAAAIFNTMTKDLKLVSEILLSMDTQSRADILGKMDAETAAKVTEIMNPKK